MDRDKQEEIEEEESSASKSKLPAQTSTHKTSNLAKKLLNTTDDDTSTESSDTFETWTLINGKEKIQAKDKLVDNRNRIEVITDDDQEEQESSQEEMAEAEEKHKNPEETEKQDSLNDDLSDGISIISECESVDRISPHPFLRDHLHDLNLKFSLNDHLDNTISNRMRAVMDNERGVPFIIQDGSIVEEQHLRQRRRKTSSTTLEATNNKALQKASQTIAPANNILTPIVRKGLQGIFLLGVALAILGLIGKIVNPTWQPLVKVSSSDNSAELEQKLNDMELQNNLMRAEIDLLNKQVKYLNTLNDPYQKKHQGKYKDYKDSKTFKAWSGNGDSLKPLDITKEDLRSPYKCPDGSFVEIANMCMEKRPNDEPSIVDQFGKVVDDLKEQSDIFKTFEQVAEELHGFQDNPFERLQEEAGQQEFSKNKPIYQAPEDLNQKLPPPSPNKEKYRLKGEDFHSSSAPYKQYKQGKYNDDSKFNKDYKNSFGKEFDKDSKEFKVRHNSKERSSEWKADKFNNNSKERKYRKQLDDSHEHDSKENHSKERHNNNKQKRKYNKNDSNENFSGEWQTNYMKHRENQRKTNEQRYQDNKNWYIKRGDGREYKRSGEKLFR